MIPNIGPMELVVVLIIAVVVMGPKKLPEVGRSLGTGLREFKSSITGSDGEDEKPALAKAEDSEPAPPA